MKMVEGMANALTVQLLKTDCGFEMTPKEAEAMALAALKAMREPTEAMEQSYYAACDEHGHCLWKHAYQTLIDAAIKEAESE